MRNMLKEDNILNSCFCKKNHFQVPAGYFDQLTDRVMANLPEQEPRIIHMQSSLWQRMPIRKIAAAVAVLAVMGGGSVLALKYTGSSKPAMAHVDHMVQKAAVNNNEDATFNEMADYTMMDNETIYASLIAEN